MNQQEQYFQLEDTWIGYYWEMSQQKINRYRWEINLQHSRICIEKKNQVKSMSTSTLNEMIVSNATPVFFQKKIECEKCENGLFLLKENHTLDCGILCTNCDSDLGCQSCYGEASNNGWSANPNLNVQNVRPPIQLTAFNVMIQLIKNLLQLEIQTILATLNRIFAQKQDQSISVILASMECEQKNGAQIKTLRCSFEIDQQSLTITQKNITSCLGGFVNLITGNCVSNCGIGKFGNITLGFNGMIEQTLCLDCDSTCFECSSKYQCLSCKRGFYLDLQTKTCKQKMGQLETTIYVKSMEYNSQYNADGSREYPFGSIIDALTNSYEIGSPFESATVTILLFSDQDHSMLRYDTNQGLFVNKDKNAQSTKIIIDTVNSVSVKVYYKMRDKFQFQVGAGLTIRNIQFDAVDSILDIRDV
ncbi:UNKNOWN [Stylonychia lemnae]|uniref:Uncharacterized protein n=1 Tax=Stylonychia lemnae TaxID=5949 RepID=A0A078AK17_STYLE|nr:UNKNOWN [Stylonychia lemnae]|eukprot:CDW82514.1 UNKNOWN [Stylonychia lemnae]